ncbi:hypothetical protein AX14_001870 [Amanita brunnescens Koide BX004]|nr:hypothetical protein AX14_001870 [Amanita brunnescens Koide BX004]
MLPPFVPPIETLLESECQTDDQVDELASDSNKYWQSGREQSQAPSIESPQPEHIERIVKSTLSDLDAVVRSAADKTHLPAEYFIWKWNAEMAARLFEQNRDGSHGTGIADAAKSLKSYNTLSRRRSSQRVTPVRPKTPRRQGTRDSKLETELRAFLVKRANENNLQALHGGTGFQWTKLLKLLANNGHYLDNYPSIPLPGARGGKAGIWELSTKEMCILLDAMQSMNHCCEFKAHRSRSLRGSIELLESKAPVLIRAPPKDGSRKSERVYLNGMSDFEGHAMCLEHQECRLSQDKLGKRTNDPEHGRGNATNVAKHQKIGVDADKDQ